MMGRTHAWLAQERGQGTVEYVGLIMLLAAVMAVVATAGKDANIAKTIVTKLKAVIDRAGLHVLRWQSVHRSDRPDRKRAMP